MTAERNELDELIERGSVLPMRIGADETTETIEVIYAEGISGGAAYTDDMPDSIHLVRVLADGTEYRMSYKQDAGAEKVVKIT